MPLEQTPTGRLRRRAYAPRLGLTPRQRTCLDAVAAHQARTGTMPSVEELRLALGLSSKSAAARLLARLEQRGAIRRVAGAARAIVIACCPHCGGDVAGRLPR
jgi:DNA-binding MarR family transcriptional regulator